MFVVSLTAGVGPAIFMTVAFLVFMLFTNHVLVPMVVGKAVSLSPPVTMLAAVGGFSVAGHRRRTVRRADLRRDQGGRDCTCVAATSTRHGRAAGHHPSSLVARARLASASA